MGKQQANLEQIFRGIVPNVYFSPPASIHMKYPCIRYEFSNFNTSYADNQNYLITKRYTVTVIDTKPDSRIPEELLKIPMCNSDRSYVADGLYHFVFTIYW